MEQTKALNALEPFLALSKSAAHPRAAADLITQATSAPDTYIFAELLQQPQIQVLAQNDQFSSHLRLLQFFSYGTWQSYHDDTSGLPSLNDAQTLKLRQLSLVSLARDRSNLSYGALHKALGLSSARELEELVITAMYAGLLHATLDPANEAVQVTSVAPLRDLQPDAIPAMVQALRNWSERCDSTLGDLEAQIRTIRASAAVRQNEKRAAENKLQSLVRDAQEPDKVYELTSRESLPGMGFNKRSMAETANPIYDAMMESEDAYGSEERGQRANKRKM